MEAMTLDDHASGHSKRAREPAICWVRPAGYDEHEEVSYQFGCADFTLRVHHQLERLLDVEVYSEALRRGRVEWITPDRRREIGNIGPEWLILLAQSDHRKVSRVLNLFESGGPIIMPILMHCQETNSKHLLAGNHRMTYNACALRLPTPTLHIDY
jgi:hypothetical protein